MVDVTPEQFAAQLTRGWRRFGPVYFRPACRACTSCESIRLASATFAPSRSQRRARRNAAHLIREVGVPIVDDERLALYGRWHAHRESHRGWDESPIDAERYRLEFAFEHPCVREVAFRDPELNDRLVGLGIVDEVPDALSAVYFFWDPDYAPASLGVAHIVWLAEDARVRGLGYVYLGYKVDGCPSLAYKGRYEPHELLEGRPGSGVPASWRPTAEPTSPSGPIGDSASSEAES